MLHVCYCRRCCCCRTALQGAYVEVGRVCGAFGVRGEVKVESSSDEPDKRFKSGARCAALRGHTST